LGQLMKLRLRPNLRNTFDDRPLRGAAVQSEGFGFYASFCASERWGFVTSGCGAVWTATCVSSPKLSIVCSDT